LVVKMKDLAKDTADDDTSVELITSDPAKGVPFNDEAFAREELLGAVRLESAAGVKLGLRARARCRPAAGA
jgi:hypothetical protein